MQLPAHEWLKACLPALPEIMRVPLPGPTRRSRRSRLLSGSTCRETRTSNGRESLLQQVIQRRPRPLPSPLESSTNGRATSCRRESRRHLPSLPRQGPRASLRPDSLTEHRSDVCRQLRVASSAGECRMTCGHDPVDAGRHTGLTRQTVFVISLVSWMPFGRRSGLR